MNTHDSTSTPGRRAPSPAQIERACHPTAKDRALTALGWYAPELTAAGAAAGAAATVWAPLGLISAALGVRIIADRVRLARRNRRVTAARPTTSTAHAADTAESEDPDRAERHHSDEEVA